MRDVGVGGQRRTTAVLVLLCVAQFMVVLDTTIVTVALPLIGSDLMFGDAGALQYVVSLYALPFGAALLPAGRAADAFGRRAVLVAGLVLFSVASAGCGLAWSPASMLAARVGQGVGAAAVSAAALALLLTTFDHGRSRARALGAWSAVGGAAGACGLLLGGALTGLAGWRWVFLINIPIGVLSALTTPRLLRESRGSRRGLDVVGTALRAAWPANAAMVVLSGTVASALYFSTLFVQRELRFDSLETGLAFLPNSVLVLVGSSLAARALPRFGTDRVLPTGLAVTGIGSVLLGTLAISGGGYVSAVLPGFALSGLGLGIGFVAATSAATSEGNPADTTGLSSTDATGHHGVASGLVNTAQQIGFGLGVALLSTLSTVVGRQVTTAPSHDLSPEVAGYAAGHLTAGLSALAAAGAALVLASPRLAPRRNITQEKGPT